MKTIDGHILSSGVVMETIGALLFQLGDHREVLNFYIVTSPQHTIILCLSWLKAHNPTIDWCNNSITFKLQPHPKISRQWAESISSAQLSIRGRNGSKVDGQVLVLAKAIVHHALDPIPMQTTINPLLSKYKDFQDMFDKKNVDHLPEH
jgi:hypothetical protein